MTDFFAVLGFARRPAIDEASLKSAYFRKSEQLHPDRDAESDFSVINAAFQTLSNPAQRLQHLIQLEFGEPGSGKIGADLGQLFGRVASLAQKADTETELAAAHDSPLLRALDLQRFGPLLDELKTLAGELTEYQLKLLQQIKTIDGEWISDPLGCRDALVQVAVDLTFIQKWSAQIRERMLKLEELI